MPLFLSSGLLCLAAVVVAATLLRQFRAYEVLRPGNFNWPEMPSLRACLKIHECANRLVINRIEAM